MYAVPNARRPVVGLLLAIAAAAAALGQSAESTFHRAYYVENQQGDLKAAAKLYDEVANDRKADAAMRAEARAHRDACREELASADFARLMPANAIAYVELNRPGDQLLRLLTQLGLTGTDDEVAAKMGRHVAISPALVREVLGIRGLAAAVTGFDAATQTPSGVVVLHPGNIDVIRGLIETALPAAADPVEPIGGFATYNVEGQVYVTLTRRLIIASQQPLEIENVIARLTGSDDDSLANSEDLREQLAGRDDSLIYFCANFQQIMPLIKLGMAAGASQSQEVAVANTLLDPQSLKTLVGRVGVSDEGLHFELALDLVEGHRNLVFNFLRTPEIDSRILNSIPSGVAGFFTASLNNTDSSFQASKGEGDVPPPVTFLDFGREFFANLVGVGVFALPGAEEGLVDGEPIPGIAAVMTVKDIDKSTALWTQVLGVISMASGQGTMDGARVEIGGLSARKFTMPEGLTVYFAAGDDTILVSPSKAAIGAALKAAHGGESVKSDPAFAANVKQLAGNASVALFLHPGRLLELAKPHMDADDLEEAEQMQPYLTDTVGSLVLTHSGHALRVSGMVTGIQDISALVAEVLAEKRHRAFTRSDWDTMRQAAAAEDREAFDDAAAALYAANKDDANELNTYAWRMLTESPLAGNCNAEALRFALRANELTERREWMLVDTLALAYFETGELERAVELEQQAVELAEGASRQDEAVAALERFVRALEEKRGRVQAN